MSRERLPKSGGCRSEVHAIPREYRIAVGFEVENRVAYEGFISPVPEIEPNVEGDRDDDGFLYLLDRKKDMIASGGVSVFASDIEEVLMQPLAGWPLRFNFDALVKSLKKRISVISRRTRIGIRGRRRNPVISNT